MNGKVSKVLARAGRLTGLGRKSLKRKFKSTPRPLRHTIITNLRAKCVEIEAANAKWRAEQAAKRGRK